MRGVACLLLLSAALFLFPSACHKETDEDKIKSVIADVQKSAGEKKIVSILGHVSKAYQDPQGNNYDGVKGILGYYFFRHHKVSVFIPGIDVVVTGPTATATFQAIFTGRGSGDAAATTILPEALDAYHFEVSLRREDSAWKVLSARWEQAGRGAAVPAQ